MVAVWWLHTRKQEGSSHDTSLRDRGIHRRRTRHLLPAVRAGDGWLQLLRMGDALPRLRRPTHLGVPRRRWLERAARRRRLWTRRAAPGSERRQGPKWLDAARPLGK